MNLFPSPFFSRSARRTTERRSSIFRPTVIVTIKTRGNACLEIVIIAISAIIGESPVSRPACRWLITWEKWWVQIINNSLLLGIELVASMRSDRVPRMSTRFVASLFPFHMHNARCPLRRDFARLFHENELHAEERKRKKSFSAEELRGRSLCMPRCHIRHCRNRPQRRPNEYNAGN